MIHAALLLLNLSLTPPGQVNPPTPTTTPTPRPLADPSAIIKATTPTIEELQEAAVRRAAVDPRASRRWLARARAAAALPSVRGELDLRRDQAWQLDQEAGVADELSQDNGAGQVIRVRVAWELDRLIFDPNELRAARAAVDMAMAREQLLLRLTQLYFERIQLLAELAGDVPLADALSREIRVREIEAVLYGLSGLRLRTRGRP